MIYKAICLDNSDGKSSLLFSEILLHRTLDQETRKSTIDSGRRSKLLEAGVRLRHWCAILKYHNTIPSSKIGKTHPFAYAFSNKAQILLLILVDFLMCKQMRISDLHLIKIGLAFNL